MFSRAIGRIGRSFDVRYPTSHVALRGAVACGMAEALWQLAFHVGSPLRGLLLVPVAWGAGTAIKRAIARIGRTWSFTETCILGVLTLGLLYLALVRLGVTRWAFVPCSLLFAALGVAPLPWRDRETIARGLPRSVSLGHVVLVLVSVALWVRCAFFVDRLPLTSTHPSAFAWIDTPFWLSIAYSVERGFPPTDPLFAAETLGYHFGCGVPVAMVRALTGLPMHLAYFATFVLSLAALPALLHRILRTVWPMTRRVGELLAWPLTFAVVAAAQHYAWAFPTTCGLPLLAFVVLRMMALRTWRDAVPVAMALAALVVTKEVHYVFAATIGAGVALHAFHARRAALPALALGLALAASRPLHAFAVSPHQKVRLVPFAEHLDLAWLKNELVREHGFMHTPPGSALHWLLLGGIVFAFALEERRSRHARFGVGGAWALGIALATYAFACGLSVAVKPVFDPPMDPFSYGWLLGDMTQFESAARMVLALTMLLWLLGLFRRRLTAKRTSVAFVVITALAFAFPWLQFWKSTHLSAANPRPEERGADPVVPLLAQVDPRASLILTDHLNWNFENPHWAGFFGHCFFQLRRGRWATAAPSYEGALRDEATLLSTASAAEATSIVRRTGITHAIVEAERSVPWLTEIAPVASNAAYRLYDLRGLASRRALE